MAGRQQTAPPQQRRSKDATVHPHQPGARPNPPHPDPAHSRRHHPAKAKVKFPLRDRIPLNTGTNKRHHHHLELDFCFSISISMILDFYFVILFNVQLLYLMIHLRSISAIAWLSCSGWPPRVTVSVERLFLLIVPGESAVVCIMFRLLFLISRVLLLCPHTFF